MSTVNEQELRLLQQRYRGLAPQAPVAYIDESYRLHQDCRPGETPFYVMAAVLLRVENHAHIRRDLDGIAGHDKWHTTDLRQTHEGQQRIEAMTDYLAEYQDPCIIAVRHTPSHEDTGRTMRGTCLTALLATLSQGGDAWDPVQMAVFEKQREQADTNRDRHTIRQAIKNGAVPRNLAVHFVSPSIENLLWLPDLVTNTYRRYITHGDTLVTRINSQTLTVELAGETSDPLAAAARIQGVSPLFR